MKSKFLALVIAVFASFQVAAEETQYALQVGDYAIYKVTQYMTSTAWKHQIISEDNGFYSIQVSRVLSDKISVPGTLTYKAKADLTDSYIADLNVFCETAKGTMTKLTVAAGEIDSCLVSEQYGQVTKTEWYAAHIPFGQVKSTWTQGPENAVIYERVLLMFNTAAEQEEETLQVR